MKPIRVGIIGTGHIASIAHIPSLISLEDVNITALCDANKENLLRTAKRYGLRTTYLDHKEMLKRENLDCVFCLTSPIAHAEIVMDCLESQIDIFCEKPLAWTIQEAKDIIKASEKSGCWVQVGYNRRFMPVYKEAKNAFQKHQVKLCLAEKNYELCVPPEHFLENRLIHAIDILYWFCGKAIHVQAEMFKTKPETLYTVCAIIRYNGGAIAMWLGITQAECGQKS